MKAALNVNDVLKLRKQIVLNSLYVSDYENDMDVDPRSASVFFEGFMEFICELAVNDGFSLTYENFGEFIRRYDTDENLEAWWNCFEECPLYAEAEDLDAAA